MLKIINLTKKFGGLVALNNVSLEVKEGEIRGIIGPNGAGKTTLFNCIAGIIRPTKGKIFFRNEDITGLPPYKIARKGISLAFQLINIFPNMKVYENVMVGANSKSPRPWLFYRSSNYGDIRKKAEEICDVVGLGEKKYETAGNLSYGDKKLLEIAMALATDPYLLLLDEPTSGVSVAEHYKIAECIKELSKSKTIILIEHNVAFVCQLASTITVLNEGSILCEGPPTKIIENEDVKRVYLGEKYVSLP
jgi:branched-chain amino acid transport system ATP-binding protein